VYAAPYLDDSSPAIAADGTIYAGTTFEKVFALSPTGVPEWTFSSAAPVGMAQLAAAIGADGTVYVGTAALTPTGMLQWAVGDPPFESLPAIGADGTLYFAHDSAGSGYLYAIAPDGQAGALGGSGGSGDAAGASGAGGATSGSGGASGAGG